MPEEGITMHAKVQEFQQVVVDNARSALSAEVIEEAYKAARLDPKQIEPLSTKKKVALTATGLTVSVVAARAAKRPVRSARIAITSKASSGRKRVGATTYRLIKAAVKRADAAIERRDSQLNAGQ